MKIDFCVLSVILFLSLTACGPAPGRHVAATLDDVESYINERPDSALAVLRALDSTAAYRGPAQRARASLLHTMALDKCYEDITVPGLLDDAEKWYAHHGTPDEKMKTLYYQGRIFQSKGDMNAAAVAYAQAEPYADRSLDRHAVGLMYLAFGTVYNRVFNTQQELKYKEKGVQVLKDAGVTLAPDYSYWNSSGPGDKERSSANKASNITFFFSPLVGMDIGRRFYAAAGVWCMHPRRLSAATPYRITASASLKLGVRF